MKKEGEKQGGIIDWRKRWKNRKEEENEEEKKRWNSRRKKE
jgi:hypothetical protein